MDLYINELQENLTGTKMDDISIEITQSELENEHSEGASPSKSVLAGHDEHQRLKTCASSRGISVKALINCIARELNKKEKK